MMMTGKNAIIKSILISDLKITDLKNVSGGVVLVF